MAEREGSVFRKILGHSGWMWGAQSFAIVAGLFQVVLLSRLLGPAGLGTIAIFASVCGLAQALLTFTSAETLMTFTRKRLAEGDHRGAQGVVATCFAMDAGSSLAVMLLLWVIGGLVMDGYGISAAHVAAFRAYALVMPLAAVTVVSQALMRMRERFRGIFVLTILANLTRMIAVGIVWLLSGGIGQAVWIYVAGAAIEAAGSLAWSVGGLRAMMPDAPRLGAGDLRLPRDVLEFEIQTFLRGSVKSVARYLDVTIIGLLAPVEAVGFYRVCKQMTGYVQNAADTVSGATYPQYATMWFSGRVQELRRLAQRMTVLVAAVAAPAVALVFVLRGPIIRVLLGEEFLPAAPILAVMLPAVLMTAVMAPLYVIPAATGKARPGLYASIGAVIAQCLAGLVLVPRLGGVGAGLSYAVYVVAWTTLVIVFLVPVWRAEGEPAYV